MKAQIEITQADIEAVFDFDYTRQREPEYSDCPAYDEIIIGTIYGVEINGKDYSRDTIETVCEIVGGDDMSSIYEKLEEAVRAQ